MPQAVPRAVRFFVSPPTASYTVQTLAIPAAPMEIPDEALAQFSLSVQQVASLRSAAQAPCVPADWLVPRAWTGAAAVVICGAGDTRRLFKWVLFEQLLTQGIAVLTFDPPGHGEFQNVPMSVENARRAARAVVDWLFNMADARAVGAIGISLGGNQALDAAARDARIAAVVAISTPVVLQPITRTLIAREVLRLFLPRTLALLRYQSARAMFAEWRMARGIWSLVDLPRLVAQFHALACVRAIGTRPKLFVHGVCDAAVPPHNARKLYEAALPERKLWWVRQGSHLNVVMLLPEMRALATWMRMRLARASNDAT
ncbi:MAG: alpha/beta hydrolase [Thermoflexales bacterium]|nr:alpha/beta hydrolase [Thermoflexales bacterium]